MGKYGPRPKPTKLRVLHGDRKDRINADEPTPPEGPPACPNDVTDEVRAIWDHALANLIMMGVATPADRDALLAFCEAVIVHRKASAVLARSPLLIKGYRDTMVRNPAVAMQRDAAAVIRAFAHEFGFTPSARSELRGGTRAGDGGDGDAARYLNG